MILTLLHILVSPINSLISGEVREQKSVRCHADYWSIFLMESPIDQMVLSGGEVAEHPRLRMSLSLVSIMKGTHHRCVMEASQGPGYFDSLWK